MSTAIFDALPGMEVAVSEIDRTLASVWDMEAAPGKAAPSEFRASQMNLVVHLGLDNTVDSACAAFDTASRFSQRYPCRTIVLCPREVGSGGGVRAKVFCECFVGASRGEMSCSEAIILSYPLEQRAYLENQASILIESDLPLYYWPNRIQTATRFGDYQFFLSKSQRIIIDSAIERPEVPAYTWPRRELVHDLVHARILPIRQSVGHFLSYVTPARLVDGLRRIELRHRSAVAAETRAVAEWMKAGVADCAAQAGLGVPVVHVLVEKDDAVAGSIDVRWSYADGASLEMNFDLERGVACLRSNIGCEKTTVSSSVRLLAEDRALAEALFF